jgi:hypothetical protein
MAQWEDLVGEVQQLIVDLIPLAKLAQLAIVCKAWLQLYECRLGERRQVIKQLVADELSWESLLGVSLEALSPPHDPLVSVPVSVCSPYLLPVGCPRTICAVTFWSKDAAHYVCVDDPLLPFDQHQSNACFGMLGVSCLFAEEGQLPHIIAHAVSICYQYYLTIGPAPVDLGEAMQALTAGDHHSMD